MSWLRIDDGFWHHPKFAGWTPRQKWAFGELMGYCARYRTGGQIPDDVSLLPRSVTRSLLVLAERSGWIDRHEDGTLWIHDWDIYNGDEHSKREALTEKISAYLQEFPDASANAVCRAVGGNRSLVLHLVRQYQGGTQAVPANGSGTSTGTGTESGSCALAPAQSPVPSLSQELRQDRTDVAAEQDLDALRLELLRDMPD